MRWAKNVPTTYGISALLVSYCLTHPLLGWGIVDERRMQTADRAARHQTD